MKKSLFGRLKEKTAKGKKAHEDGSFDFDRISERVSRYFSAEPEKERVLRHEDFDAAGDTYYAVVSARYKVAQRVSLTLLVLFLLLSVMFNIKSITFDNLFYLIKDLGAAADVGEKNYETLAYDAASDQSFELYRGGLAVVSRTNVSSFTSTGRRTLNTSADYSNPVAASNKKYLFVYDMGDRGFDIYNSFAKVHSERTDYPIYDMAFAENGSFVTLSRSEEHMSVLTVYGENFAKCAAYKMNLYCIDVSIDKSGERLGAVYVGTDGGIVCTHVVFYDLLKRTKTDELIYKGEFPLGCSFLDGGGFVMVSDSSAVVYDRKLKEKYVSDSFSDKAVSGIFCDSEYVAVAVNDGVIVDLNEIIVFDKNGDLVYENLVLSDVGELSVCDGYLFIKNSEGVMRVGLKNGVTEQLVSQAGKMFVYDTSTAIVCLPSKAAYLDFNN